MGVLQVRAWLRALLCRCWSCVLLVLECGFRALLGWCWSCVLLVLECGLRALLGWCWSCVLLVWPSFLRFTDCCLLCWSGNRRTCCINADWLLSPSDCNAIYHYHWCYWSINVLCLVNTSKHISSSSKWDTHMFESLAVGKLFSGTHSIGEWPLWVQAKNCRNDLAQSEINFPFYVIPNSYKPNHICHAGN